MNPRDYAETLASVFDADTSALTPQNMRDLPQLDNVNAFAELNRDVCSEHGRAATHAPSPTADNAATDTCARGPALTSDARNRKRPACSRPAAETGPASDMPVELPTAAPTENFRDSFGTARMRPYALSELSSAPFDESVRRPGLSVATDLFINAAGETNWFQCVVTKANKQWPTVRFESGVSASVR